MPTSAQLADLRVPLINGSTDEDACAKAGIPYPIFQGWIDDDPELADEVESWRAEGRIENLALIKRAALGHPANVKTTVEETDSRGRKLTRTTQIERVERDWRAAAWLEERAAGGRRKKWLHGRPVGLTPQVHAAIVSSFQISPKLQPAAAAARIGYSTLKSWISRGRVYRDFLERGDLGDADVGTRRLYHSASALWETGLSEDRQAALSALAYVEERTRRPEDEPYLDLVLDIDQAVAGIEIDLTSSVLTHARTDGRLALRALETFWPDRYGRRLEVTGAEGGPIAVDLEAKKAALIERLDRVDEARRRAGT